MESYFGGSYRSIYPRLVDDEADLRADVGWIVKAAPWGGRDTVLDLACGYGRHLRHLMRYPGRLIGLDLVAGQLLQARHRLGGSSPPLVQGDMHRLPLRSSSVQIALLLFNSFGYRDFATPAADIGAEITLLRELARVLTPRGCALLEIPNRDHVRLAVAEEPHTEIEQGDRHLIEDWRIDEDGCTLRGITKFVQGAEVEPLPFAIRLFSLTELTRLATAAGLRPVNVWGDLRGAPYHPRDSLEMVIALERMP